VFLGFLRWAEATRFLPWPKRRMPEAIAQINSFLERRVQPGGVQ